MRILFEDSPHVIVRSLLLSINHLHFTFINLIANLLFLSKQKDAAFATSLFELNLEEFRMILQ